jgi:hypothetical protein
VIYARLSNGEFLAKGKIVTGFGNLITGQQNFSGSETARLVIQALGE